MCKRVRKNVKRRGIGDGIGDERVPAVRRKLEGTYTAPTKMDHFQNKGVGEKHFVTC